MAREPGCGDGEVGDNGGKDVDSNSPTWWRYHQILWSKKLPSEDAFKLDAEKKGAYLYYNSALGKYCLASDSTIHTYSRGNYCMDKITVTVSQEELKAFRKVTWAIGGYIIFPANQIDGKNTINQARRTNGKIKDRFNLTMECIRRWYAGEESPLGDTIRWYAFFFKLFGDFKGYCEFFLLQDLMQDDFTKVNFFLPFKDFDSRSLPANAEEYREYMINSMEFIRKRNERIREWSGQKD
ncbi:MAG: hypothetical protein MdMp014T_0633 [Treponematales bacterium]